MNLYDYLESKYNEEFLEDFDTFDEFVEDFFNNNFYLNGCTYRELLTDNEEVIDEVRMSYKLDKVRRNIEIIVLEE